jgi:hypothetical protein
MNLKLLINKNKKILAALVYLAWVVRAFFLSYLHPNKYALDFTDLPSQLKGISPSFLAFLYLAVFIPAVIFICVYVISVLYILFRNSFRKN